MAKPKTVDQLEAAERDKQAAALHKKKAAAVIEWDDAKKLLKEKREAVAALDREIEGLYGYLPLLDGEEEPDADGE